MTATDVTGFDAIFSAGFFATFSRFCGARLTKLHINTGEAAKKIQWRASSGDSAPKLQISVPCRGRTCLEFLENDLKRFSLCSCRSSSVIFFFDFKIWEIWKIQSGPGSVRFGYGLRVERLELFRWFLYKKGFSVFQYIFKGIPASVPGKRFQRFRFRFRFREKRF